MKEVQKDNSGFAETGFNVNMEVHIDVTKYFGMSMLIKQGTYAVDTRAYKEKLMYRNPGSDFRVRSDDWIIGGALLGFYGNFFVHDSSRTKLLLKGYIGLMNGNTPYYLIKEKKPTAPIYGPNKIWEIQKETLAMYLLPIFVTK